MKSIKILIGVLLTCLLFGCSSGERERLNATLDGAKRQYPWLVKYIEVGESHFRLKTRSEIDLGTQVTDSLNRLLDQNYDRYLKDQWIVDAFDRSTIATDDVPGITFEFMARLFAVQPSNTAFDIEQHIVIRNALARDCRRHKHAVDDGGEFVHLCEQIERHHVLGQWQLNRSVSHIAEGYYLHMDAQLDTVMAHVNTAELKLCNQSTTDIAKGVFSIVSKPELQPTKNDFIDLNFKGMKVGDSSWAQIDFWLNVDPGQCKILTKTFVGVAPNFSIIDADESNSAFTRASLTSVSSDTYQPYQTLTLDSFSACGDFEDSENQNLDDCQTSLNAKGFKSAKLVGKNQFFFAAKSTDYSAINH